MKPPQVDLGCWMEPRPELLLLIYASRCALLAVA